MFQAILDRILVAYKNQIRRQVASPWQRMGGIASTDHRHIPIASYTSRLLRAPPATTAVFIHRDIVFRPGIIFSDLLTPNRSSPRARIAGITHQANARGEMIDVRSAILGAILATSAALGTIAIFCLCRFYCRRTRAKKYPQLDDVRSPLFAIPSKEFNVSKDAQTVQPGGIPIGSDPQRPHAARLARTPSISSQSSLESSASRTHGHRGSSPQIRTFGPDGRTVLEGPLLSTSGGRSPSPLRAASLDARGAPIGAGVVASHGSLASLASLVSETPSSPRAPRCLSPLLIPPRIDRSNSIVDSTSPLPPASPLGTLQPDLYTKREGPLFLGPPDGLNHGPSLGRLHMRLKYDFDKSDFSVHLIEAHDLAGCDQGGFNDPYVRLMLLPEVDNRARQTPVHRNDPNPFFDQHFKFPVSHDELSDKTLLLQVYDYDRYSRNEVTGEVRVALEGLSVACGVEVWGEIGRQKRPQEELQELYLSLSYLPSAERLTVVVNKARNLLTPGQESKDSMDPFVKVYLIVSEKRVKKKKTASCKDTTEPTWNEALSFSITPNNLQNASLEICVASGNQAIGWCCVGANESGQEGLHWNQMIQQPRKATAMWHTLR